MSLSRAFIAASLACGLAGCGSTSAPTAPAPAPASGAAASYAIAALGAPVVIGATAQLRAVQVNTDGTTTAVPDSIAKTWSSSDTAVARVDAQGVLTGVTAGVTTIGVTVGGVVATATALAVQAGTYKITGLDAPLAIGTSAALHAVANLANGSTLSINDAAVTWTSSNVSVARVDTNGVLTAVAEGSATIGISLNGAAATSQLARVMAIRYRIEGLPSVLAAGEKVTLQARLVFTDGSSQPASQVIWSTSKGGVASIDPVTGILTAQAEGSVDVSFAVGGQPAVTDAVTVVRNVSGAWTMTSAVESCNAGFDCQVGGPTSKPMTIQQTRDAVTVGVIFTGTVSPDGSLTLHFSYCLPVDSSNVDVGTTVSDWRLVLTGGSYTGRAHKVIRNSLRANPTCSGPTNYFHFDGVIVYTFSR